jgi:hypothetical protein
LRWEIKNIKTFILKFKINFASLNLNTKYFLQKLKKLLAEEKQRELAGFYDADMDEDDEETKRLLSLAAQIEEKEALRRQEFRLNKGTNQPKMPRTVGRKRERSMSRLEQELGDLGLPVAKKRMRHLEEEQQREHQGGKKIRVGRSPSLPAPERVPRDEQGIPDKKVSHKTHYLALKFSEIWII